VSRYGRLPHTRDHRDYLARPAAAYTGAYVDLEPGFPPVWDQMTLGSCVAFGCCAALAYARTKMGLAAMDPAQLFTYYAARDRGGYPTDQDTGLEIRDGFASLAHDGVPPSADWPYRIDRFAERPTTLAYTDGARDEAVIYGAVAPGDVDAMVASGYPVVIGFDVYSSFESAQTADTGVMAVPARGEQLLGGHCVVLCSTPKDGTEIRAGVPGTLYRRARNSWGTGWGDRGWFWFPVAAMVHASDFWQVQTVSAPDPPVPPPPVPPVDADVTFAATLRPWVLQRHIGGNARAARAGRFWLAAKDL
jgi:C1A family cysteine protease